MRCFLLRIKTFLLSMATIDTKVDILLHKNNLLFTGLSVAKLRQILSLMLLPNRDFQIESIVSRKVRKMTFHKYNGNFHMENWAKIRVLVKLKKEFLPKQVVCYRG